VDAARTADRRRAVFAAILLASFLVHAPSLVNGFTWDDHHAAMGSGPTAHPLVSTVRPLGDYFASNWWPQYSPGHTAYRPLTTLWFALRHAVCGDHALTAHLLNVALHTLAVALGHLWLRRLGLPFVPAALGAAIFGLHALHGEATANLVGGAELLALVCGLAGALALLSAAGSASPRRYQVHYPLAALGLFAAAASKESGIVWCAFAPLCVLAAHFRGALPRVPGRGDVVAIAVAVALPAVVYLQLRAGMLLLLPRGVPEPVGQLANPLIDLPAHLRIASGFLAAAYGAWLVLFPFDLAVDYGPAQLPVVRSLGSAWGIAAIAAAAATGLAAAYAARNARRRPLLALALACLLGFGLLVSNVPMPVFMHFAERTWTTPSLALALAVAAAAARPWPWPRLGLAALAVWLAASVATALPRNFVWRDDETLVASELLTSPRSVRMQLWAGAAAARRGQLDAAGAHFARAAELAPELVHPWAELAGLALRRGDPVAARALLDRTAHAHPNERARYEPALRALGARIDAALAAQPSPR
jgi:hypothetical protein